MVEVNVLPLERIIASIVAFIPKLALGLFVLFVAIYLSNIVFRLTNAWLIKRKIDPELQLLLSRIAQWTVIILGTINALAQVDFDVGGFLTGLGIIGFTIGFALQDIAKNFVAGILLLLQQPFDIGNAVEVGGYGGQVVDIKVRSTTLKTWDGCIVIIPNADVYTNTITNFSDSVKRRIDLTVGVAYDSDLTQVTEVLNQTLPKIEGIILDDPAPAFYFDTFGDSAINLTIYIWCETNVLNPLLAKDRALQAVKQAFEQAEIEIPYPMTKMVMQNQ